MLGAIVNRLMQLLFVRGPVSYGRGFHLGMGSIVSASTGLTLGTNVHVGKNCTIQVNGTIGSEVLIANSVGIVGRRDHDFRQIGVPIHSADSVSRSPELAAHPQNRIEIGDDVWICYGATVLSGITIGRGAIVAAGAVVTEDVAAYAIVSGNPAKVVGSRFNPEEIARHEALWHPPGAGPAAAERAQ